jgi:hypothetical protein
MGDPMQTDRANWVPHSGWDHLMVGGITSWLPLTYLSLKQVMGVIEYRLPSTISLCTLSLALAPSLAPSLPLPNPSLFLARAGDRVPSTQHTYSLFSL